jgi:pimeloyl-ACP methyl ester carboxylesterase
VTKPPAELYPGLEEVSIPTPDGVTLAAWFWPQTTSTTTFILFHGNAGDRGGRLGLVRSLHERGYAVLISDYRGYGGSEGRPSEAGLSREDHSDDARPTSDRTRMGAQSRKGAKGANDSGSHQAGDAFLDPRAPKSISRPSLVHRLEEPGPTAMWTFWLNRRFR